jgi:hypothetical protein
MKNSILLAVGLVIIAIALSQMGCASIITGTSQNIMINSEPSGAKIITDTGLTVITPATIRLPKGRAIVLTAQKDGYEKSTQLLNTSFNGWFLGNILLGGLIGMIVDLADGAYVSFDRSNVFFSLTPEKKSAP